RSRARSGPGGRPSGSNGRTGGSWARGLLSGFRGPGWRDYNGCRGRVKAVLKAAAPGLRGLRGSAFCPGSAIVCPDRLRPRVAPRFPMPPVTALPAPTPEQVQAAWAEAFAPPPEGHARRLGTLLDGLPLIAA